MIDFYNRDYVTSVKYISLAGNIILLLLIIFEVNIFYKWCEENDLEDELLIDINERGYSNNNFVMSWLKHFIKQTQHCHHEAWLFFIMNKFRSHSIILFFKLAIENKIVLFCLFDHSTHLNHWTSMFINYTNIITLRHLTMQSAWKIGISKNWNFDRFLIVLYADIQIIYNATRI